MLISQGKSKVTHHLSSLTFQLINPFNIIHFPLIFYVQHTLFLEP